MIRIRLSSLALALSLACLVSPAFAEDALLKPVPTPDTSKLSPEAQKELTELRRLFEEAKAGLVGEPLAEAFAKLAGVYARYGFYDAARVALEDAMALSPYDGRYPYLLGVFVQQAGKADEAKTLYERALALDQAYLPIRYRLADAQFRSGDLAGAKSTLLDIAQKRTDLAPAPALLGEIALREKRYPDAIRYLEQALKADPSATSLYRALADAYAGSGDAKRAQEARAKAGAGIAAFGDPLVQGIYATAASDPATTALALAAQGKHADARKLLESALAAAPGDAALLAAAARVEADAGNGAVARQRADAALKADPNGALPKLAQGVVAETAGQEAQAVTYYEQAVRADLKNAEARLLLGNAYMRRQAYAAAAEQYRGLTVAAPEDSSGYARLVAAEAMAGRCAAALDTLQTALTARPKDGTLNQLFVRVASTCSAAKPEQRKRALDIAKGIYDQRATPAHSEAYALALAANGRAKEAVDYQAASLFEAAKTNDQAAITRGRTFMQRFEAGQPAQQPWPVGHPLFAPPRLQASTKLAAAAAPAANAPPKQ